MLNRGDFGVDVVQWQRFLRARGFCNFSGQPLNVNGDYDDETEHATMCFQYENGLRQTGVLCPQTEALARSLGWAP